MIIILFEAIIVGIYSIFLFLIINFISLNKLSSYQELFIIGFFKHLFGFYSNIHSYYCETECKNKIIVVESLIEAFVFLFIGLVLSFFLNYNKNKVVIYFLIGFSLHIIADISGLHKIYCKNKCTLVA